MLEAFFSCCCLGLVLVLSSTNVLPQSLPQCPTEAPKVAIDFPHSGFVRNEGQWNDPSEYVLNEGRTVGRFGPSSWILQLRTADKGVAVHLSFVGATTKPKIRGVDRLPGTHNFFRGRDPAHWHTRIPSFAAIIYQDVYDGIDIGLLASADSLLEYEVYVAPHGNLDELVFQCDGIDCLSLAEDGSLILGTALGDLIQKPPVAWEEGVEGNRLAAQAEDVSRENPTPIPEVLSRELQGGDERWAEDVGLTTRVSLDRASRSRDERCRIPVVLRALGEHRMPRRKRHVVVIEVGDERAGGRSRGGGLLPSSLWDLQQLTWW